MSYLTYGFQMYKYIYKMTNQQNDLLRETLKLEIVWFNIDITWYKQLPSNTVTIKRKATIITH